MPQENNSSTIIFFLSTQNIIRLSQIQFSKKKNTQFLLLISTIRSVVVRLPTPDKQKWRNDFQTFQRAKSLCIRIKMPKFYQFRF